MTERERKKIEEQARSDARTGIGSCHSDIAAAYRLQSTSGPENKVYQDAFKEERKKPSN